MANAKHIVLVNQSHDMWNKWREDNPKIIPDLSNADLRNVSINWKNLNGANLSGAKLYRADLEGAILNNTNLKGANLTYAKLSCADLIGSDLKKATLDGANLIEANFTNANLEGASLNWCTIWKADFTDANLVGASLEESNLKGSTFLRTNLTNANLIGANLVKTKIKNSNLKNCRVYGVSAWGVKIEDTIQTDLLISSEDEPLITVDNLEVAQFVYLLTNNEKIRGIINTITSKVVLILGRFTEERKKILDSVKIKLRNLGYLPILFDFEKPLNRDFTETVSTLAHLAKFIIADITEPRSIPHELRTIIPNLQVPIQPLLQSDSSEYGMFIDFKKYPWVLDILKYEDLNHLLDIFEQKVVLTSEKKLKEIKKIC